MATVRPTLLWLLGIVSASACGGGGGGTAPGRNLAVSSGNNQIGNAGAPPANPLAVIVREVNTNNPVSGVSINWAVGLGGGSVTASSLTDASGIATATRTLGADSVVQTTTASGTGLSGSPVTFSGTSRIQGATQIQLSAGNTQTDTIGAVLGTPYAVLVRDETNTPVPGVSVNWSVTGGGGSVSNSTVTTDASGIASVQHTLGTAAGAQTAQARVTGLNGNPVTFSGTATAGNAVSIVKTSGDGGTAAPGGDVTYVVTTRDAHNNPRSGVRVVWAVASGGGSITSPNPNTTGPNGQASATHRLGSSTGANSATATADTLPGSPFVTFNSTAAITVTVSNNFFNPQNVVIAIGGTVRWNWSPGGVVHNVTFLTAGSPADIPNMSSGSAQRTFPNAGSFNYECTIHAGMTGSVTVQ
ncbi:MAG: Ig-like domain-containing protein [Gemmatimonadales bacterium]